MSPGRRRALRFLSCAALLTCARDAAAQHYLLDARADVAAGIEGGEAATTYPRLARSRVRIGFDLRVDEFPQNVVGGDLLVDFGTHSSVGIDGRYFRRISDKFELNAGCIGFVFPGTLIGPSAALLYRLPLSSTTAATFGPEVNVFVLGADLPSGTVLWQGLFQVGINAPL